MWLDLIDRLYLQTHKIASGTQMAFWTGPCVVFARYGHPPRRDNRGASKKGAICLNHDARGGRSAIHDDEFRD